MATKPNSPASQALAPAVREMKRQINSSLFERLLLSRGDANKEQVLTQAEKGAVDFAGGGSAEALALARG